MKKLTMILLISAMVLFSSLWAEELKLPQLSQAASVTQTIGTTEVKITYHRPGVKERVIWGDLVPYDRIWRVGANEATTIEVSNDVTVEGNKLTAGKYALFAIPGKEEWTFIFSKQADIWGTYGYSKAEDLFRIKAKPMPAPHCEWMHFMFANLKEDSAKVILHWEKIMVGFTINVDTTGIILKKIEDNLNSSYKSSYYAANFAFRKEMYDKAKKWVNISTAIKKTYWNMLLKAKIYKQLAETKQETKEAVKILEEANMLIKDLPDNSKQYATEGPKLLEEWTGKKK